MRTERLQADPNGVARAGELLRDGGLVAFATETVYGLGADATDGVAVARIFEAKGRPRFNPLIVHVADLAGAERLAHLGEAGLRLAAAFWPGPLTLVAPLREGAAVTALTTAGLDTVGVRVPAHPLAQAVLRAVDRPVAAPSANPSGRISPTTAAHVLAGLDGRIDAVLDGGACSVGVESTIVGLGPEGSCLLRPGGVPRETVEACLGQPLAPPQFQGAGVTAPGQLASHYAPTVPVRLHAEAPFDGEAWLGFGEDPAAALGLPAERRRNLSPAGDLREAAAALFADLRALDAIGTPIAVAAVPEHGLGLAINDRVRRAASPRSEG
ncbi:MAG: L-threonylcarbamoyladenylate synthase [Pseudomonadota bacterium]